MLKKAGLIVAASVAAMVAVSPLAFADDHDGTGDQNTGSLVSGVSGTDASAPINVCNNDVQGGLVPVQNVDPNVPVDATAGLLGDGGQSAQDSDQTDTNACGNGGDSGE